MYRQSGHSIVSLKSGETKSPVIETPGNAAGAIEVPAGFSAEVSTKFLGGLDRASLLPLLDSDGMTPIAVTLKAGAVIVIPPEALILSYFQMELATAPSKDEMLIVHWKS